MALAGVKLCCQRLICLCFPGKSTGDVGVIPWALLPLACLSTVCGSGMADDPATSSVKEVEQRGTSTAVGSSALGGTATVTHAAAQPWPRGFYYQDAWGHTQVCQTAAACCVLASSFCSTHLVRARSRARSPKHSCEAGGPGCLWPCRSGTATVWEAAAPLSSRFALAAGSS